MHISKINIKNFRNFKDSEIKFNDGINVIIGHNNAGKTNLLKALALVIDTQTTKRLDIDDFCKYLTIEELKNTPPKITITVTIKKGQDQEEDDLVTIANWLTKLEENYEAQLTYEFFLPEKKIEEYTKRMSTIDNNDSNARNKAWTFLKDDFIRYYIAKIWAGDIVNQTIADSESLQKIDFQFLSAIRDVERDMISGKNTLLKDIFEFFIDYDIKQDKNIPEEELIKEIQTKKNDFSIKADDLIKDFRTRFEEGKKQILSYAKKTGAAFNNATPTFEGSFSEKDLYSVLKLIVEYETGIKVPATHNGLGYNNLIFMSLLLAKMQINANIDYLDANAKVFTTLVIEEPEAHLHPSMQYKFLKFLKENKKDKKVRQIFVTTHSTHITSAISLDEIICLHNQEQKTHIGYPGQVFLKEDGTIDSKSKKHVQRFLDATKSDMLFAQKVLLVEGLAEQLLMSVLAKYLDKSLEDNHVAIINVGGRYFSHFLHLFDTTKPNTIPKTIVCLTDRDPEHKDTTQKKPRFTACYPFEVNINTAKYEYKTNPTAKLYPVGEHHNITIYSQPETEGKTFEYELAYHNPTLDLLITDSMSNKKDIEDLMTSYKDNTRTINDLFDVLNDSEENEQIQKSINSNNTLSYEQKKKHIIAAIYLNSITIRKGEHALELCHALEENLNKKGTPEYKDFIVPPYIKQAIEKLCN